MARLLPLVVLIALVAGLSAEEDPVLPFDVNAADLPWRTVNDSVMGGRSSGGSEREGSLLRFTGRTNTNGGGFSSIRAALSPRVDLSSGRGFVLRVRGDGRTYTLLVQTEATYRGSRIWYRATFPTTKDRFTYPRVALAELEPRWRGRSLSGPALDASRVTGLGLMIYDKRDGPFRLDVSGIRVYPAPEAFSLSELQWKRRPLVLFAPTADDARLAAQVQDVETSRAAFAERDMVTIVVPADGTPTLDGVPLRPEDAAALREHFEVEGDAFALRLVGKDGGVKRAAAEPVPMATIYAQVDEMPMRRREAGD